MRLLLRRGLKEGPADSLSRLKRAAEEEHRGCARGAGRVGPRLSDAEPGLSEPKRALAQAEGDEYRQI
jgi:hypothetical protein